jgi:thioredoxin reductase (NADPH)
MRAEARDYYAVASASPAFAAKIGTLARERLGGLQNITAEPPAARVILVGHRLDGPCAELRRFLGRNQISFDWLTPDAPNLPAIWPGPPPKEDDCPALRLTCGTVVAKPTTSDVARLVGLQTKAEGTEYDVLIIGGGPAGLAAAVYGASEGLRTIVVEREAPGGQAGTSSRIENYLGFPNGVSGDELASRALQQARRLGAEILVTRSVHSIDPATLEVVLDGDDVIRTRSVILATGVAWRRVALDGFDRLIGKGIYYGAARSEAGGTHGLNLHLIGAGNSAGQAALHFANHARSVTLVVRGDALEKSMSQYLIDQLRTKANITVLLHSEVKAAFGEATLTAIDIQDNVTKSVVRAECGGLFVFVGADAETQWLPSAIARDAQGYLLTGDDVVKAGHWSQPRDPYLLETSIAGVFACGDVRLSSVKRVAAAVGEGSMAIAFVHQFLAQRARTRA